MLEGGLAVRGVEFAEEMLGLTQEALEGLATRPDVDGALVASVRQVDERLKLFLEENAASFS